VKPFQFEGQRIDAPDIIASLGTFDNLLFDPDLMRCPARYAARISLAFTATDASVLFDVGEIQYREDIEVNHPNGEKYCFTDGVGTTSREVIDEIWKRRRKTRGRPPPSAIQIRFKGSKGVLSVDHTLFKGASLSSDLP